MRALQALVEGVFWGVGPCFVFRPALLIPPSSSHCYFEHFLFRNKNKGLHYAMGLRVGAFEILFGVPELEVCNLDIQSGRGL